jgi:hypothetical protein
MGLLILQKRNRQIIKRQKEHRSLLQRSLEQSENHRDPLWYQTPELGIEGLSATIGSRKKLPKALKDEAINTRKKLCLGEISLNEINYE